MIYYHCSKREPKKEEGYLKKTRKGNQMTNKEVALNIYTVRKAKDLYMKLLRVMAFIEKNKEVANLDLFKATGATSTILEALEQSGKIRKEIRKEETITVETWGYHGPLDDNGIELPDGPDTITITYEGREATIPNPFKAKEEYGSYKAKVQVRRKYWIWVE